jgi:beta-lactamase superfamily II metal-dependent hydrolase
MRLALLGALVLVACAGAPPAQAPAPPASTSPPPPPSASATPAGPRPKFTVHVVDVGTGLAVFVEGPDFALVYDAGSNDDLARGEKNRFLAYLHAVAPTRTTLDHVLLSHPHRDHVELLADVIERYHPRAVWDSGAVNPICGYRRFLAAVEASGASYHSGTDDPIIVFPKPLCEEKFPPEARPKRGPRATEGEPIRLGDRAQMTLLHVQPHVRGDDYNEASLVTVLDLDGTKVLLMGDAQGGGRADPTTAPAADSVEAWVLAHHRAALDADVLVVGHHGSKTSSRKALVDAVTPKLSVISSGPMKYGSVTLPDPEIVAELAITSRVLRTDVDDDACAKNPHKIGTDADGFPGGCSNVQITIHAGTVTGKTVALED